MVAGLGGGGNRWRFVRVARIRRRSRWFGFISFIVECAEVRRDCSRTFRRLGRWGFGGGVVGTAQFLG